MSDHATRNMSVRAPIPGIADFPRNAWYVVAFSDEVSSTSGLARTACKIPVFLYRDQNGVPVALHDQCPHRGLPFSQGKLIGNGQVRCGYHGFEFGKDGRCVRVPTRDRIPSTLRTKSYPLVERWEWIWLWPGNPELADPSLIPDHNELRLTAPGWSKMPTQVKHWPGNYMLQVENSSDNLHLNFVHEGLVDDGVISALSPQVEQEGFVVRTELELKDTAGVPIESWWGFDIDPAELRDRTSRTETYCPSLGRIEWTITPRDGRPPQSFSSCLAITPETDRSHWVFYATTINFKQREVGAQAMTMLDEVLAQDIACFTAIQDRIDQFGIEETDVSIGVDERALRARRIIGQMLASEKQA